MSDKILLEINQTQISARAGEPLIDVLDANGIKVPRFCYHRKLSVSANCRMCLVEIENSPKPMPACATPVTVGMKVFTKSDKTINAQKSVMEFLLINHPLDCPICDQGGECDLQDLSVAYGTDFSRFTEKKRIVKNKNLGPLVSTDMTRCIHCTLCVRFGKEVAGIVELGGIGRGEHMEIGTYIEKSLSSEISGNIIDICPVGALTSKPFRYQARSWELTSTRSIAPHDCLGSNILIQTVNQKVVRVLPADNEDINEIWLSDRDRFSYLGLASEDRIQSPMLRNEKGELETCDWDEALTAAAENLGSIHAAKAGDIGALISPNSTVEEIYLLKKLLAALGSNKIEHRLRQGDYAFKLQPGLACKISDVENMDSILIIGSDIQKEVPLLAHRIRKAANKGTQVYALNPKDFGFSFKYKQNTDSVKSMQRATKALANRAYAEKSDYKYRALGELQDDFTASADIINSLNNGKSLVLVGQYAIANNEFATLTSCARAIADLTDSAFGLVSAGANAKGAAQIAALNPAAESPEVMLKNVAAIILHNLEINKDSAINMDQVLSSSEFVLATASFMDQATHDYADVVLPLAAFSETSGTFVNMQGDWQSFKGALAPMGEARPGWKILRVLANKLDIGGFDFMSSQEVKNEAKSSVVDDAYEWSLVLASSTAETVKVNRIYDTDALVRRTEALQNSALGGNR